MIELTDVTERHGSWDNLDQSERLRFDPTSFSLSGLFLAQLAVGVLGILGVLIVTSDPGALTPWVGLVVLLAYGAIALAAGALTVSRRDA